MANNQNTCCFTGNMGGDPEIRYTQSGNAVATISLGVSKSWKNKQTGEKQETTTWVRCVAFKGIANVIRDYTQKGSKLRVITEYGNRKYQDGNGNDRWAHEFNIREIELLDRRQDAQGQGQPPAAPQQQQQPAAQQQRPPQAAAQTPEELDDDIPF